MSDSVQKQATAGPVADWANRNGVGARRRAANYACLAVAMGLVCAPLFAQDDTTRRIVPQEFVQARHGKAAAGSASSRYKLISADSKLAASGPGSELRQLGVTVWRLRPAVKTDTGARL